MSRHHARNIFVSLAALAALVALAAPVAFVALDWIDDAGSSGDRSTSVELLEPCDVIDVASETRALPVLSPGLNESRSVEPREIRMASRDASIDVAPSGIETSARPETIVESTMPLLAGRITSPEGKSIADARVMIARPGRQWSNPSTVVLLSDHQGRFVMPASDAGPWMIHASHRSWKATLLDAFIVEPDSEAHLVMESGIRIVGQVTTTEGAAIEDASIVLLPSNATQLFDLERSAVSDGEGAFELAGLSSGSARLKIQAQGFAIRTEEVRLPEAGDTEVVLELTPAQQLTGQMVDEQGKAIPGAVIQVIGEQGPQSSTTGPDGTFLFESVGDDALNLHALARGYGPLTLSGVTAWDSPVTLTAQSASPATGRVNDRATGEPVAGARVLLISGARRWTASSDEDGRFTSAALPRGDYRVRVQVEGFQVTEIEASLPAPGGLELEVKRGAAFDGQVLDAAGQPLANAWVRLMVAGSELEAPRFALRSKNTTLAGSAHTDEAGHFEIQGLPDGEYWVVAAHKDYAQNRGERVLVTNGQSGAPVVCCLEIGASIQGHVSVAGAPAKHGHVRITNDRGETMRRVPLDESGRYAVAGLSAGTYRLIAEKVGAELEPVTVDLGSRGETTQNIGR